MSIITFWCLCCQLLTDSTHCFGVSIADFEHKCSITCFHVNFVRVFSELLRAVIRMLLNIYEGAFREN